MSIEGGYILQARKIDHSEIADKPPHFREIFNWLYRNANFKDRDKLNRGQLVCTYRDIQEALSWHIGYIKKMYSKSQCETAMKYLVKAEMITTTKTTRGSIVTICNYSIYQDAKNYESGYETKMKSERNQPDLRHDTEEREERNKEIIKENSDYLGKQGTVEERKLIFPAALTHRFCYP